MITGLPKNIANIIKEYENYISPLQMYPEIRDSILILSLVVWRQPSIPAPSCARRTLYMCARSDNLKIEMTHSSMQKSSMQTTKSANQLPWRLASTFKPAAVLSAALVLLLSLGGIFGGA